MLLSWSSGLMKSDADRSFQMMTCPAETANLTSWPLVSASASSFRNDCAGSLNYASQCLTDRYQHLIVNCCVFSNQFSNNIKCAILLKTYHTKQVSILKPFKLAHWSVLTYQIVQYFHFATSNSHFYAHYSLFREFTIWRCSIKTIHR